MIEQLIITIGIIWGVFALFRVRWSEIEQKFTQKHPLWFIKWYGDKVLHQNISDLLYECPKCMAWVWTCVTSIYFGFSIETPMIALAVCGLNYYLLRLLPYTDE